MRRTGFAGAVLALAVVMSATGCGDSDDDASPSADTAPATTTASTPSPDSSASYVAQVNALCEAMIDKVMGVRGDEDGSGGGDLPSIDEFEAQEMQIRSIHAEFDAKVDALPVTDADRAAADAFDAFRETSDAEADELLELARDGDQAEYEAAISQPPPAEFEAKRRAMNEAGIECPAR